MALKESSKNNLKKYPNFKLKSTDNTWQTNESLMGENGLIVIFTCNHCPYAKALWDRLITDTNEFRSNGINIVTINPNINPAYPDDSFENMVAYTNKVNLPFHYLVDETQMIAKQFDATCTPDVFLLNPAMGLIYRGAYDDNWQNENDVKEKYLLNAITSYISHPATEINVQKLSMGCSIKWVEHNA